MLYLPISKSWIVSQVAQRIYFICALASLGLLGTYIASRMALAASGMSSFDPASVTVLILRVLFFPGVLGAALLSIAMWYFWFGFDKSHWLKKAIWFLPLYSFILIGPTLYYFLVYRRSNALE